MKLSIFLLTDAGSEIIDYLKSKYQAADINFLRWETGKWANFQKVRNKPKDDIFVILCQHRQTQKGLIFFKFISFFAKSRKSFVIDSSLNEEPISLARFVFADVPRFALELACSLYILFFTWIMVSRLKARNTSKALVFNKIRKIAYLRTDLWFGTKAGGSVGHIAGVANALHKQGYQLFFISSDRLEMVDENKIPTNVVPPSRLLTNLLEIPELAYSMKFTKSAAKIFREEAPDLIYKRYSLNNYSGVILSQKFSLPFILEYNGSEVWIAKSWGAKLVFRNLAWAIEDLNLRYADLIVVVSKALKEELLSRGIDSDKILVNPNGVDPEVFDSSKYESAASELRKEFRLEDRILVGFIGTFGKWHGAEVLAEAIEPVVSQNQDTHFLFIGDGLLLGKVKSIIKDAQMDKHVSFTGLVPQRRAPGYLAACDILVSPHIPNPDGTEFFGSPTKLFEYMAMGKGIVASELGQIAEVLVHEETAILVEPGNVQQLATGILRLASDKTLSQQLGNTARKVVLSKYAWEQNVKRVIQALEELRARQ